MKKIFFLLFSVVLGILVVSGTALAQYGGGGGGYAPPPTVLPPPATKEVKVIINSGAKTTSNTRVTLSLPQTNADQMAISNNSAFVNASWERYAGSKEWVLTPEYGQKTVYVMFRNSSTGMSTQAVSGSIELVAAPGQKVTPAAPTVKEVVKVTPSTPAFKFTRYLKIGLKGTEVRQLQIKLKSLKYYTGKITGVFNTATRSAVMKFQKAKKIAPVGWVGPATRRALNK